jgi:NosR/NirI family nitrous oxide reductase transcriptional regulator
VRAYVAQSLVVLTASAVLCLAPCVLSAQDAPEEWIERLQRVMPQADAFSDRRGQPPVFEAYARGPDEGARTLIGYAFLTSDLPPEQKGFTGPIEVLVGMDLQGDLTGVLVTNYTESHLATRGDFLAAPGVQEQFAGKSIVDLFRVRRDVEGISGATISVDAMSRGIRNAAREVAVAYRVGPVAAAAEARALDPVSVTLAELEEQTWTQMALRGLSQRIAVLDNERTSADVTLIYLRNDTVAEILMGPDMLADVFERAGPVAREHHLVLAGVDGPSAGGLNLARMSIVQGSDTVGLEPSDVLLFGPTRQGKLDGQFRMSRVLLFDQAVDMASPFTFELDLRPGLGLFTADYPGELPAAEEPQQVTPSLLIPGWLGALATIMGVLALVTIAYVSSRSRR